MEPLFGQTDEARARLIESLMQSQPGNNSTLDVKALVGPLMGAYLQKKETARMQGENMRGNQVLSKALGAMQGGPAETSNGITWNERAPNQQLGIAQLLQAPETAKLGQNMALAGIQSDMDLQNAIARQDALMPGQIRLAEATAQARSRGEGAPSSVREWEYYNSLSSGDQERYRNMKRATLEKGQTLNPDGTVENLPGFTDAKQNSAYADKMGSRTAELDTAAPIKRAEALGTQAGQMGDKEAGIQSTAEIKAGETKAVKGEELLAERRESFPKARGSVLAYKAKNDALGQNITKALQQTSGWTSGIMNLASFVPGTPQHNLSNTLNSIKANAGFGELQDMRENSPTGGALGQVSENENRLLQSLIAAVEQSQSPAQLQENLMALARFKDESAQRVEDTFNLTYKDVAGEFDEYLSKQGGSAPQSPDVDSLLKKYGVE